MRPFEHFLNVNLELKILNHKSVMKFLYIFFFVAGVLPTNFIIEVFKNLVPKHMPDTVVMLT